MDNLYFNGYIYKPCETLDHLGRVLLERAAQVEGTYLCRYGGKPAMVYKGTLYTQGRNILPGSRGIWDEKTKQG